MSFVESIRVCLHKYVTFNGRASRAEFWWFYLFIALVGLVAYVIPLAFVMLAAAVGDNAAGAALGIMSAIGFLLVFVVVVGLYVPFLAVGSRRLHDRGQSAWLLLLLLVPCGSIALIVLWVLEGTPGDNVYGPRTLA